VLDYEAASSRCPARSTCICGLARDAEGNLQLQYPRPNESTSNPQYVSRLIVASNPSEWREPSKPVLQITTPYRFVADEPVWINQLPPFYHFRRPPLAGPDDRRRFPSMTGRAC